MLYDLPVKFIFQTVIYKMEKKRAGNPAQEFKAWTGPVEDLSSVPCTYIKCLTATCDSSFRDLMLSSVLQGHQNSYIPQHRNASIHIKTIDLKNKKENNSVNE